MVINTTKEKYVRALINHCSRFQLDGLPAAGDLFYQRISLEEVFVPLRLSESLSTNELRRRNAGYYQIEDDKMNSGVSAKDDHIFSTIDRTSKESGLNGQFDYHQANNGIEAGEDASFTELISFIDSQIDRPSDSLSSECKSFVNLLDEKIEEISRKIEKRNPLDLNDISSPKEFISAIDALSANPITSQFQSSKCAENLEENKDLDEKEKQFDALPVGPLSNDYPSRKVLLARPGCGKTIISKRIALAYASKDKSGLESYNLPGDLFPILLYCRSINDEMISEADAFLEVAFKIVHSQFPDVINNYSDFKDIVDEHIESNSLLIIIDGLDEILSVEKQDVFSKMLLDYLQQNSNVHLLLTSRLASYVDDNCTVFIDQIPFIRRNEIMSMNSTEIDLFIHKWHEVLYYADIQRQNMADGMIEQLHQPMFSYLKDLIKTPLHLANIILIAKEFGRIPNDKIQLYDDYLRITLHWNANDIIDDKGNNPSRINNGMVDSDDLKTALSYTAFHMTKAGKIRFTHTELKEQLLNCSHDLDCELKYPISEDNVDDVINQLEKRTCVIQKHGEKSGYYEFAHKQLQEYLTAYAIVHGLSEDGYTPSLFVAKYYRKNAWREVVILVVLSTTLRNERINILNFLINEAETQEENYSATNILFELIANGVKSSLSQKHAIYDLIFKEHITDVQINQICNLIDDLSSEDFRNYVSEKFAESVQAGNSRYGFAMATIEAFELVQQMKNPLKEAERLVIETTGEDFVKGLYIFTVLGWCKYCDIKSPFGMYDITLSKQFFNRIYHLILSDSEHLDDIATALKDIVLAKYIVDDSLFDLALYNKLLYMLTDESKRNSAEKILSVFPINYLTLSFCPYNGIDEIKTSSLSKYRGCISDPQKAEDAVFAFSVCALLGCWAISSEEYLTEFNILDAYYEINKREADDAAKIRLKALRKQVTDMSSPISAGMDYYEKGEYEKAKSAFTLAYRKGDTTVKNNLAYMLRRREINDVVIEGKEYSVEELLAEGIISNEPFSIINFALYESCVGSDIDYDNGLSIARRLVGANASSIYNVYSWWNELAESGEIEGYVVLAWLVELGLVDDIQHQSLEELKEKF